MFNKPGPVVAIREALLSGCWKCQLSIRKTGNSLLFGQKFGQL